MRAIDIHKPGRSARRLSFDRFVAEAAADAIKILRHYKRPSIDRIAEAVRDSFACSQVEMALDTGSLSLGCAARQIAMVLCKRLTNKSCNEIGLAFRRRRNDTVRRAAHRFDSLIDNLLDAGGKHRRLGA